MIDPAGEQVFFRYTSSQVQYCEVNSENDCDMGDSSLWQNITPANTIIEDLKSFDHDTRKLVASAVVSRFTEADFVERAIKSGSVDVNELEALKGSALTWQELPGAFYANSHCEAIGRKA